MQASLSFSQLYISGLISSKHGINPDAVVPE